MKAKPLVGLGCFFLIGILRGFGDSGAPLHEPHPESHHSPTPPIGILGLPLGTFAVIEGVQHPYGMGPRLPGFAVDIVNGVKAPPNFHIPTNWPKSSQVRDVPDKRYVLHGYEIGAWAGQPLDLPKSEPYGAQVTFGFRTRFVVTSVEKVDGVTTPDARPVDPKVPLVKAEFISLKWTMLPLGILGLPLGTFAIIQARPVLHPILMSDAYEITAVNGRQFSSLGPISIPNVTPVKGSDSVTLHGFEAGEWDSTPLLPETESPSTAPQPQQPFQFFPKFIVTSQPKAGG